MSRKPVQRGGHWVLLHGQGAWVSLKGCWNRMTVFYPWAWRGNATSHGPTGCSRPRFHPEHREVGIKPLFAKTPPFQGWISQGMWGGAAGHRYPWQWIQMHAAKCKPGFSGLVSTTLSLFSLTLSKGLTQNRLHQARDDKFIALASALLSVPVTEWVWTLLSGRENLLNWVFVKCYYIFRNSKYKMFEVLR